MRSLAFYLVFYLAFYLVFPTRSIKDFGQFPIQSAQILTAAG